jgi:formylglycine-generating enzyme required for sulfatase activity
MPDNNRKLRVFLSHGPFHEPTVYYLFDHLLGEGWVDPWLAEKNLLPGQDRELEIKKVIESTDVALVCVSRKSLNLAGSFQREINILVSIADEKPEGSIFIIPILLDDCVSELPQPLSQRHNIPYNINLNNDVRERAYKLLVRSLRTKFDVVSSKTAESHTNHWVSSHQPEVVEDLTTTTFGGFMFAKIPKGKFIMGSRASNNLSGDDEHPQRPYAIPYNYWITCFPISNEQFSEYAVSTGYTEFLPKDWKKKLDQPIVNVSWRDAVEYTKWLTKIFKREIQNELIFRLPTEAEWERASRGDLGSEWPWGNENLDDFLGGESPELLIRLRKKKQLDEGKYSNNFAEYLTGVPRSDSSKAEYDPEKSALNLMKMMLDEFRSNMELPDIGMFSPVTDSQFDVADMMGSVWEWTQSLYKLYPYDVDDGRENMEDLGERVIRGAFRPIPGCDRFSVRSAKREHASPDRKEPYLGFRIVIAPQVS